MNLALLDAPRHHADQRLRRCYPMNPLDLAIIFLGLGITEAIIKPIAKRVVQRRILKAAPAILRAIDARLPELLALPTGEALEAQVRTIAEQVTGESWTIA